jgi:hypothetical protein
MPAVILNHFGQFDVIMSVSYPGSVPCVMDMDQVALKEAMIVRGKLIW